MAITKHCYSQGKREIGKKIEFVFWVRARGLACGTWKLITQQRISSSDALRGVNICIVRRSSETVYFNVGVTAF